jgi:uncharacterized membrane protein YgcG
MNKMRRYVVVLSALVIAGMFGLGGAAHADPNNFVVKDFRADYTLSNHDRQGELRIVEHIEVDFRDFNHGILRAIPSSYKNRPLHVHVNRVASESGAPARYSTYGSNGNLMLKIGDANRTVTGAQEYTIDYRVSNVIGFYADHDELYWNINGTQWDQTFDQVGVTLHLPSDLKLKGSPICYAGVYGTSQSECRVVFAGNMATSKTRRSLTGHETLTIVAAFPKHYFQPSAWYETMGDYGKAIISFLALPVIFGGGGLWLWLRRGRDAKGRGTIVPECDAPDSLTPIEVGTIIDFKVDNRDLTATIINLALGGYLKIIESKTDRRLRKDALSYTLELKNADFTVLKAYERSLLEALFHADPRVGDQVNLTASKSKLSKAARVIRETVAQDLTTRDYFKANPLTAGRLLFGAAFALVIAVFAFGGLLHPAALAGAIVALGLGFFFAKIMPSRSAKGTEAKEHILGLKLYLETAEKERLKKLQGPDAAYATNHTEPVKTVELFEKLLPYAIVLGVEQDWARQFEGLYLQPPDWYAGNWTSFNAGIFVANISGGMQSSVDAAFASPSSSSSSGFGGGGFSGGGGGGGGGGGW